MYKVMFLQVRKLSEALGAHVALEWPLPRVCPQVHLQVRELAECLEAHIAFVVHFTVLLLQRVRQRSVTAGVVAIGTKWRSRPARQRCLVSGGFG